MKTVLLSFQDDVTRDKFLQLLKNHADELINSAKTAEMTDAAGECIKHALGTVRLDPPIKSDHERVVAIFVSGKKMVEGTLSNMRVRFQQEVDSHSAPVVMRELRDGEWVDIQARRLQRR